MISLGLNVKNHTNVANKIISLNVTVQYKNINDSRISDFNDIKNCKINTSNS